MRRKLEAARKAQCQAALQRAWHTLCNSGHAVVFGPEGMTSLSSNPVRERVQHECDETDQVDRDASSSVKMREVYQRRILLWMLWRVACKHQAKKVQRMVRRDKAAWIATKTEELARIEQEGVSSETHKQVKRCLVKVRQNQVEIKRGPIRDAAGHIKTTQDEKEMVWQEHWSRLYAGKMLCTTRSFKSTPKAWTARSLGIVSAEALFSPAEVEAALKHQMTNKASVDGIPAKQMQCILQQMVPTWTKAFNYFLEVGDIPQIYKGTLIFVTPKKVAPSTPGDYRGLQLMMWSAKVFARAVYMKCISRVDIAIGQFGLGQNTGIDYPHVIVTQISEWARIHRRRLGWWYVDVKTAFDKIIRQLLFAPGHTLTLEMLVALGISERIARGILIEVAHDRPILWEHNLPVEIQRILSSLLQDTWILLPPEQGEAQMSTHMGTPQGNSLSGLLYILYQQKIMQQITQYMHETGIAVILPEVMDNTFEASATGTLEVPMLAYHDDALAVIESHSAESIVDKMRMLVDYAMTKYHGRNLLLNWSKLKSEIMFTMPSQELATFHATLNTEAKKRSWDHPAIFVKDFRIRVIRSYVYLGRRVVDNGSTNQHAKERAAIASATIHSFRRIYNCPRVKIEVKANLCTAMYTIPQLTSGFATLRPLDSRSEKTYTTSYLAAWKACLGKSRMDGAAFAHISEERILDTVRKPSWTVHADALRLRFALRLVRCTCPVARASLGCIGLTRGSWWSAFAAAANRMRASVHQ
eukprot:6396469-Amphidinium_carterae.1